MKRLSVSQPATQTAGKSDIQGADKPATHLENKPAISPTLEEVRARFETWRRSRKPRSRIPKSLWSAAAAVCIEQPIYRVSQALRLNYTELKGRVGRTKSVSATQHPCLDRNFVELSLGLEAQPMLCSIELESPRGSKVKMSFSGKCRDLDPLELARFFWGAVQ
jgi:hypothetical protein